jgi:hypothetical protein
VVGVTTPILLWTRGWVSREGPAHRVLAARNLDFGVLTDRHLLLFSAGFFTRRPHRLVYSSPLDELRVRDVDVPVGRRLSIRGPQVHELRMELSGRARSTAFANALVALTRARRT